MRAGDEVDGRRLQRAYRYCEWVTYRHYENFPVASWLLPAALRPHVAAIYAFARSADDFADEARYQGRSLQLLEVWRRGLPRNDTGGDVRSHPIFLALADTVRRFDLPVQLLGDLLTAFTMDVTKRRYATWEELMTYCRYSANPVGRLVLLLFGIRDPELHARSDDICTGLQMANHWQDLRIDVARDMLYVPKDLMDQHGVTEEELKGLAVPGALSLQVQALMRELVARTRARFESGELLLKHVSGGLRLELRLTVLGGRGILDRIEAAGYDVFRRRPSLGGADKAWLLIQGALAR